MLIWTPRVLCILFAAWVSVFALDVFGEGRGFWKTSQALIIHLIPTWFILGALAISWRWEWVGAILFGALGVLAITVFYRGRRPHQPLSWHLMFSVPPFLIGGLFLANWMYGP